MYVARFLGSDSAQFSNQFWIAAGHVILITLKVGTLAAALRHAQASSQLFGCLLVCALLIAAAALPSCWPSSCGRAPWLLALAPACPDGACKEDCGGSG